MIYLDNAATTKPFLTALKKAEIFNTEQFFNPSALYREGINNNREIKTAKEKILKFLGLSADKFEVIFTSGGTESDNTAIFSGVKRGTAVTDTGEHAAVYNCFKYLKERGSDVVFCDLNKDGSVNTERLFKLAEEKNASFVSVMHVNNETGAVNDINYIAKTLKKINKNLVFHSDGVQAYGKIDFAFSDDIDFYSISAHKINALKGTGALIKRKTLNLSPLILGGGQEDGKRSGTENLFGIKMFEYASEIHYGNIKENFAAISSVKKYFVDNLDKNSFTLISGENSSPYILSVAAIGVRGETLMHCLEEKGVLVGNGSACSSKKPFSRVIEACGIKPPLLNGVIRISFDAQTTLKDTETAVKIINETALSLKRMMK